MKKVEGGKSGFIIKCLNKSQSSLLEQCQNMVKPSFDVESFLAMSSQNAEPFLENLAVQRSIPIDSRLMIQGINYFMPKNYFKPIIIEWILSNAERNSMFYMKDIFLSEIDTQVRIDKSNLAYDVLDDYVNTKTQRFFKNFGERIENEILDFKGEIRGQWEKTLVQKDLIIQQKNALIRSLSRAQAKNPQLCAAKRYFAHVLNIIYSKAENLGKCIFRTRKGKLIGLANCLLKFIDKWKRKYKVEFENLKILENKDTMDELTAYHLICQVPKYKKMFNSIQKPLQFKLISSIITNLSDETNYQEQENLMLARMEKIYEKKETFMTIQSQDDLFDKIYENNDYLCGYAYEVDENMETNSMEYGNVLENQETWKPPDLNSEDLNP